MPRPHVGLDLDNTVIDYDEAFVRVGRESGLLPPDATPAGKEAVKAALRAGAGGEEAWMRLQGQVYGPRIAAARLYDGVASFLTACRERDIRVSIISHKTRLGHFDETRTSLWTAARAFLDVHGVFSPGGFGLDGKDLHFLETRDEKIARIAAVGCTVFVDDLHEVLADAAFPPHVRRIWFAPGRVESFGNLRPHPSWTAVHEAVMEALAVESPQARTEPKAAPSR